MSDEEITPGIEGVSKELRGIAFFLGDRLGGAADNLQNGLSGIAEALNRIADALSKIADGPPKAPSRPSLSATPLKPSGGG